MLYLGLAVFVGLAWITYRSASQAWSSSVERSRSEAIFDLVQVETPTRPTHTPGAVAWLDLKIKEYGRRLAAAERPAYRELVSVSRDGVPVMMQPLAEAMARASARSLPAGSLRQLTLEQAMAAGIEPESDLEGTSGQGLQFRSQSFLAFETASGEELILVLTRRQELDRPLEEEAESASNLFLRAAAPYLASIADELGEPPLQARIAGRSLEVVRYYVVAEDGTFLSLPRIPADASEEERRRISRREGQEFRRQPELPTYVSNEFFFRFDFQRPEGQVFYSGIYLDLAGYGLVTTVTLPVADPATGFLAVAAIDLTFDIDWNDFARHIGPPQRVRLVSLDSPPPLGGWRPWTQLRRAVELQKIPVEGAMARVLAELADREQRSSLAAGAGSLYHAVVPDEGAIALFQVAHDRWLVVLFPEARAKLPWLAASLLILLGSSLLLGFEINRRRAEAAHLQAEDELQEKENLLESMRVPLMVVDPNTDEVVYGNAAAVALGIEPGRRIGSMVAPGAAREHYDHMQKLGAETRRAYGVPLRVRTADGDGETRHVVVRSTAVAAPIPTLQADERHRLGICFPLEPEADLAIFSAELEGSSRDDERRRLAGLLAHGVDTLARVLSHCLRRASTDEAFVLWLSSYLERRLAVTAWLLDHWRAVPPLPPATTVEAPQIRATLERFQAVFSLVREDRELRSRLHWDNGVLAADPGDPVFDLSFDWPDSHLFTSPVRGGAGFFFEEVLVNALRHGKPGCRPRVGVELDLVRRELCVEVVNEVAVDSGRDPSDLEPYGGRRLLERLAELFGWEELSFARQAGLFRVRWRIHVGERAAPGELE